MKTKGLDDLLDLSNEHVDLVNNKLIKAFIKSLVQQLLTK